MTSLHIAMVCHEANRIYCQNLGDFSQMIWAKSPQWKRDLEINGVEFHLSHLDAGDEASHENWCDEMFNNGWMYGKEKCAVNKTHPCMVDFSGLPKEQQKKDALFRAIVHALA